MSVQQPAWGEEEEQGDPAEEQVRGVEEHDDHLDVGDDVHKVEANGERAVGGSHEDLDECAVHDLLRQARSLLIDPLLPEGMLGRRLVRHLGCVSAPR